MRRTKGKPPGTDLAVRERLGSSNVDAAPIAQSDQTKQCTAAPLHWTRDGSDWVLKLKQRKLDRVFADVRHPGMWGSRRADGRLSDMSDLGWAKNAVLLAAEREIGGTE